MKKDNHVIESEGYCTEMMGTTVGWDGQMSQRQGLVWMLSSSIYIILHH